MELNADVESFFSKFDNEENELVDKSASFTDTKQEEVKSSDNDNATSDKLAVKSKEEDKTEPVKASDEPKEEDNAPFHKHPRWQEMVKERKELRKSREDWESEKQEMAKKIAELENKPLTDEELESMTPKEIQEYTKKQLESEFSLKSESESKEQKEAEEYIEQTLSDLRDEWNEFAENELLKLAADYTDGDILKAFELYQRLWLTKEEGAKEQEKESAKRKAAESNTSNRSASQKTSKFVSWTSWDSLNLK